MKRYEKWQYSFMHSSAQHQMEVSGQLHAPPTLPPEKEALVPFGYEVG